jgi:hypothetical protein
MMKIASPLALITLLHVTMAFAQHPHISRAIYLNDRHALATLQRSNPEDYAKIQLILRGLSERPVAEIPRWLKGKFSAREVDYSDLLLTSYPPQRHLSFVLNDTYYSATVTLETPQALIVPTK